MGLAHQKIKEQGSAAFSAHPIFLSAPMLHLFTNLGFNSLKTNTSGPRSLSVTPIFFSTPFSVLLILTWAWNWALVHHHTSELGYLASHMFFPNTPILFCFCSNYYCFVDFSVGPRVSLLGRGESTRPSSLSSPNSS